MSEGAWGFEPFPEEDKIAPRTGTWLIRRCRSRVFVG